jgi:hypothetical protein
VRPYYVIRRQLLAPLPAPFQHPCCRAWFCFAPTFQHHHPWAAATLLEILPTQIAAALVRSTRALVCATTCVQARPLCICVLLLTAAMALALGEDHLRIHRPTAAPHRCNRPQRSSVRPQTQPAVLMLPEESVLPRLLLARTTSLLSCCWPFACSCHSGTQIGSTCQHALSTACLQRVYSPVLASTGLHTWLSGGLRTEAHGNAPDHLPWSGTQHMLLSPWHTTHAAVPLAHNACCCPPGTKRMLLSPWHKTHAAVPLAQNTCCCPPAQAGDTALHLAARAGHIPVVHELLRAGADPCSKVLMHAPSQNKLENAYLLPPVVIRQCDVPPSGCEVLSTCLVPAE